MQGQLTFLLRNSDLLPDVLLVLLGWQVTQQVMEDGKAGTCLVLTPQCPYTAADIVRVGVTFLSDSVDLPSLDPADTVDFIPTQQHRPEDCKRHVGWHLKYGFSVPGAVVDSWRHLVDDRESKPSKKCGGLL